MSRYRAVVFLGDKPSPSMKPDARPFQGAKCEARVVEWIIRITGYEYRSALNHYRCVKADYINLDGIGLDNQIGYTDLELCLVTYTHIVTLGNEASNRLTSLGIPHFKLPHPSGRNRVINNKAYIDKKLEECKDWLKERL